MAIQGARVGQRVPTNLGNRYLLPLTVLSAAGGAALTAALIVVPSADLRVWSIIVLAAAFPGLFVAAFRGRLRRGRWSRSRRSRIRRWVPAVGVGVVAVAAAATGRSRAHRFIGNPRMMDGRYYLYGHGKMTEVTRDQYLQVANSDSLLLLALALLVAAIALVGLIGWEPKPVP